MNEVLCWLGPSGASLVAIVLSTIAMRRTRERDQNAEALEARTSQREDVRDQKSESNLMQAINRMEANLRADMADLRREVYDLRREVSATRIEIRMTGIKTG